MSKGSRIAAIVIVLALVGGVLILKSGQNQPAKPAAPIAASASQPAASAAGRPADAKAPLPRLVDLGAGKCIPCKMMAPILEELKREYAGRLEVVFIDVWQNEKAIGQYKIRSIPTQVFYDSAGRERFRHEGFFSKEDILAKWKELGVSLGGVK